MTNNGASQGCSSYKRKFHVNRIPAEYQRNINDEPRHWKINEKQETDENPKTPPLSRFCHIFCYLSSRYNSGVGSEGLEKTRRSRHSKWGDAEITPRWMKRRWDHATPNGETLRWDNATANKKMLRSCHSAWRDAAITPQRMKRRCDHSKTNKVMARSCHSEWRNGKITSQRERRDITTNEEMVRSRYSECRVGHDKLQKLRLHLNEYGEVTP